MIFRTSPWSSTGARASATCICQCATRTGSNGRKPAKPWSLTISRGTAAKTQTAKGANEMGKLTGKTAVVTGSTSGIGLAYARAFAGAGANIVLNGMGAPADIEKERAAIETDFKVKAVHSPADMTKPAEIAEMIALGESTFGSVDILVNNAGIQFVSPIEEFPIDKWDAIIAINLSSAFYGIRAVVPAIHKLGW